MSSSPLDRACGLTGGHQVLRDSLGTMLINDTSDDNAYGLQGSLNISNHSPGPTSPATEESFLLGSPLDEVEREFEERETGQKSAIHSLFKTGIFFTMLGLSFGLALALIVNGALLLGDSKGQKSEPPVKCDPSECWVWYTPDILASRSLPQLVLTAPLLLLAIISVPLGKIFIPYITFLFYIGMNCAYTMSTSIVLLRKMSNAEINTHECFEYGEEHEVSAVSPDTVHGFGGSSIALGVLLMVVVVGLSGYFAQARSCFIR